MLTDNSMSARAGFTLGALCIVSKGVNARLHWLASARRIQREPGSD